MGDDRDQIRGGNLVERRAIAEGVWLCGEIVAIRYAFSGGLRIVTAGAVFFAQFAAECLPVIESDGGKGGLERLAGLVVSGRRYGVSSGVGSETDSGAELAIGASESWGGIREFDTGTGDSVAIGVIDLDGERLIGHNPDPAYYSVFGYLQNGGA